MKCSIDVFLLKYQYILKQSPILILWCRWKLEKFHGRGGVINLAEAICYITQNTSAYHPHCLFSATCILSYMHTHTHIHAHLIPCSWHTDWEFFHLPSKTGSFITNRKECGKTSFACKCYHYEGTINKVLFPQGIFINYLLLSHFTFFYD